LYENKTRLIKSTERWSAPAMIFLSPDQLREVEYLINQSRVGVHHLFKPREIKRAYKVKDIPSHDKYLEHIKELFFKFISQDNIKKKRRYYKRLSPRERAMIIRTYFNIVENELVDRQTFLI
jgi:hypothetical protein